MGEGTECGLAGQTGRLQQYLTSQSLPWGSSTGNAAGEVEFLARGAAADPAPTRRSLIERRISASQHRGKVRHAVLARSQHRRDRRKTMTVRLRHEPFRAAVAVGSPWGEEDQEDLLHHHRAAAAQWATPCSARTNFLASDEKALANFRKFLAKTKLFSEVRYWPGWAAEPRFSRSYE